MTVRARLPFAGIRRIFSVVRSATSASPPGRNAIPHGTCSPVATVRRVGTRGDRVGAGDAVALAVGAALTVAEGEGWVGVVLVGRGASEEDEPHAEMAS